MPQPDNRLGRGGVLTLVVLLGLLAAAVIYAIHVWQTIGGTHISGWGWLFLVLGVVVTVGLGAGLMGLVFYSSRHDMDR